MFHNRDLYSRDKSEKYRDNRLTFNLASQFAVTHCRLAAPFHFPSEKKTIMRVEPSRKEGGGGGGGEVGKWSCNKEAMARDEGGNDRTVNIHPRSVARSA